MNVKIFVFLHFPCQLPDCFSDRSIYVPIQCGRAVNGTIPGMMGDDTGDNISALNRQYNEMTAVYWIARHYGELGNPEYVGFDHYRRFLNWDESMLSPKAVVARKWFSWRPLREQFANCHDTRMFDRFSRILEDRFSAAEKDVWRSFWKSHGFYICNMFIMHRDNFKRYADFMLGCIDILRDIDAKLSSESSDIYQSRQPSFILERMTSYWIWREKKRGNIDVRPSMITHFPIQSPNGGSSRLDRRRFLWFLRQAY